MNFWDRANRPGSRIPGRAIASACALLLLVGTAFAGGKTYTTNTDFDLGNLNGVNHNPPGSDQLQLNVEGTTFPVMWIANAGEDTVSKIDTVNNVELARYKTWFNLPNHGAWDGVAPSRTAVDSEGNCYVLNRHFDGRRPLVMKILSNGFIDRNGNGIMNTSSGSTPILLVDSNANNQLDAGELADERVAWAANVGSAGSIGRAICIGTDGYLWVGTFNNGQYFKVDPADGHVVEGPYSGFSAPYGCLVDGSGTLWSVTYNNYLQEFNTTTHTLVSSTYTPSTYNLALGGNGHIYMTREGGYTFYDVNPFVAPHSVATPAYTKGYNVSTIGINVDGADNIVVGHRMSGISKYKPDGTRLLVNAGPYYSDSRGIIIDSENNIWQVLLGSNRVAKYRGSDGAYLGYVNTGSLPYTYSDASGFALRNITTSIGYWTVILDGGKTGVRWGRVNWSDLVPAGTGVEVRARAANNAGDLTSLFFSDPLAKDTRFDLTGRYLQVQVKLAANTAGTSPVLYDLTARQLCDVNFDGAVNIDDINLIGKARGSVNALYDIDKDNLVTVYDTRTCTVQCDKASCAK